MRNTLRRSCAACAKAKHSCDLRTPRCSRCISKRVTECIYANEPLTAAIRVGGGTVGPSAGCGSLSYHRFSSVDPFDSYPRTRLPKETVQRLIYSFLHKISFQYYPLDLDAASNPFVVSWWPLALGDPALFHVSLQTACLDEDLLAGNDFRNSDILMADSVALIRRKVEDTSLAVQDATMNSVITLATIEYGKGNLRESEMHVNGVKKLVDLRGGIGSVRQSNPLTSRMISWVSLLIMGHPQFPTQDDTGGGDGLIPIPEWHCDGTALCQDSLSNLGINIDSDVGNVLVRLQNVFRRTQQTGLPTPRLHDLTCFVIHRLLLTAPGRDAPQTSSTTECLRYAVVLYMFIIHGPTYYSHAVIMNTIFTRFLESLQRLQETPHMDASCHTWLLSIALVASSSHTDYQWIAERAKTVANSLKLGTWDDVLVHIRSLLWLGTPQTEIIFRPPWVAILSGQTGQAHR